MSSKKRGRPSTDERPCDWLFSMRQGMPYHVSRMLAGIAVRRQDLIPASTVFGGDLSEGVVGELKDSGKDHAVIVERSAFDLDNFCDVRSLERGARLNEESLPELSLNFLPDSRGHFPPP